MHVGSDFNPEVPGQECQGPQSCVNAFLKSSDLCHCQGLGLLRNPIRDISRNIISNECNIEVCGTQKGRDSRRTNERPRRSTETPPLSRGTRFGTRDGTNTADTHASPPLPGPTQSLRKYATTPFPRDFYVVLCLYRDSLEGLHVVARIFFLLFLKCFAWSCLGPA